MTEGKINPLEARQLREAFRETDGKEVGKGKTPIGDRVEICSDVDGRQTTLIIFSGNTPLARIPISNGTLKRLKRELGFFKRISTMSDNCRHGNFI